MEISYTAPLHRAWQRAKAMLFRPLHLEKWLVIGFAAFLANLLGTGGNLFGWNTSPASRHGSSPRIGHALEAAHDHLMALLDKPVVLLVIAVGLTLAGILLLVCAWLSARARFVFLDNVVTGRGEFVEPWRRTGRLGRSLFLWFAGFSFAWTLPLGVVALTFGHVIAGAMAGAEVPWPPLEVMVLAAGVTLLMSLLLGFVSFLTRQFVLPLMLMHDESASRAWIRFWPLLTGHLGDFVAYAMFVAVVWIGVLVALAVAGVASCCIGLALMMIPYVGSVVLLPVEVTARALGPEFLAQYGPEWDLFTARAPRTAEPGGPLPG